MMSLTFGPFTQVSGSGPLGPLVRTTVHTEMSLSFQLTLNMSEMISGRTGVHEWCRLSMFCTLKHI